MRVSLLVWVKTSLTWCNVVNCPYTYFLGVIKPVMELAKAAYKLTTDSYKCAFTKLLMFVTRLLVGIQGYLVVSGVDGGTAVTNFIKSVLQPRLLTWSSNAAKVNHPTAR